MIIINIFHGSFKFILVVIVEILLRVAPNLLSAHILEELFVGITDIDVGADIDVSFDKLRALIIFILQLSSLFLSS